MRRNHQNHYEAAKGNVAPETTTTAFERHYTPEELAELWQLDRSTIRRMFRDEPGVFKYSAPANRKKREYVTLRIPASIVAHVHRARTRRGNVMRSAAASSLGECRD